LVTNRWGKTRKIEALCPKHERYAEGNGRSDGKSPEQRMFGTLFSRDVVKAVDHNDRFNGTLPITFASSKEKRRELPLQFGKFRPRNNRLS